MDNQNYGIYNILELLKGQQQTLPEPWTQQFKDSSTKGEKGREETQSHHQQGQSSHREGKEPIFEDEDHEPYQPELVRTPPGLNDCLLYTSDAADE